MAHRELAARYAKGLNAATQRVVELETAVADADYKADQASMAASAATCALGPSTASRERSSRATTARIKALEAKLASRPPANNELARQLDEARKSLTEEHRQLIEAQRQLTSSKSFATRLQRERAQLEESQTSIAALTAEREQEVMRLKTELGREKKRRFVDLPVHHTR